MQCLAHRSLTLERKGEKVRRLAHRRSKHAKGLVSLVVAVAHQRRREDLRSHDSEPGDRFLQRNLGRSLGTAAIHGNWFPALRG